MGEVVKVFGVWGSLFSRRVEIALKMKGVEYEFIEEDLQNKSELLLKYNPVHKKIPVLVHNGKPILESAVILEYIDETWKNNPLLPSDPYERAQARFWAKFIDDKFALPSVRSALSGQGEGSEEGMEVLNELLKHLEIQIKGNKFFGGKEIGYLDIIALIVAYWFPVFEEVAGKEIITKEKYPGICTWAKELVSTKVIKENLPEREKLLAVFRAYFAPKG